MTYLYIEQVLGPVHHPHSLVLILVPSLEWHHQDLGARPRAFAGLGVAHLHSNAQHQHGDHARVDLLAEKKINDQLHNNMGK